MSELNKILKKHLLPRGGNRWNILGGIDNLMIEVDKYEKSKVKENELLHSVMLSLLKVAKCPNCDGSGAIPHEARTPNGSYVDWEQCQWCDEQKKIIDSEA